MPRRPSPAVVIVLACLFQTALKASDETLRVPELNAPVEIKRDRWGISHINAKNEHDLFFAQGFNAARDRLFQLEIWRRQATGTLAEIQGEKALARDIGSRLLRFRGDLKDELDRYHPHGSAIIEAFVAGINAYVSLTEREPERLPLEFKILGIKPGKWTAAVVISRHNGLYRNVTQEVQYARLIQLLGEEATRSLVKLHPGRPQLKRDASIDLSRLHNGTLTLYAGSRAPLHFQPDDVQPQFRAKSKAASVHELESDRLADASTIADLSAQGSNNWVLSAARSETGAAIMANDPHRAIQIPSLRYWVHLTAPGWNVIGAGEPALPGVSVGHNEHGAWGFTIFAIDQEDLYVYETDPNDPKRYRYRGGWETMRVEHETIAVKGKGQNASELRFTRHGPVVSEDRVNHAAYAIRAAWLEPGCAPYLASLRLNQASNWDEFRAACREFRTPSENLVWADVEGHIGWQAVGLAPVRKNWDGLVPIPGDGRYEWDGFLAPEELPSVQNPKQGAFATANQDNLPPGFAHKVSFQWSDPFRFERIEEVLGSKERFNLKDMMALQHDEMSIPARNLVPLLRAMKPRSEQERSALAILQSWDFKLDASSPAAAIYVAWEKALKRAEWERSVPEKAREIFPVSTFSTELLVERMTRTGQKSSPDARSDYDRLVTKAFQNTIISLSNRFGPDPASWRYGQAKMKHVMLEHVLSEAVLPEYRKQLDVGPLPRGGYAHTVNSTSDSDNQATGASFRIIADTGDWDRSVGTNTPGQSGDPANRHYGDLFQTWAEGAYFPVYFSPAKVDSVVEMRTRLTPTAVD